MNGVRDERARGLAPAGLAPAGLAPAGLAPGGLAPAGLGGTAVLEPGLGAVPGLGSGRV
jgi:hypothetical protein